MRDSHERGSSATQFLGRGATATRREYLGKDLVKNCRLSFVVFFLNYIYIYKYYILNYINKSDKLTSEYTFRCGSNEKVVVTTVLKMTNLSKLTTHFWQKTALKGGHTHLKTYFVKNDNSNRPTYPLKWVNDSGQKTIIQVSFDERGTPFKRSPTHQNRGLVDPVRVNRIPIALGTMCLHPEICGSILPCNCRRLDHHRVFDDLHSTRESSKYHFHHRNIVAHFSAFLFQRQHAWPRYEPALHHDALSSLPD